jgi:hypothetical protein
VPSLPAQSGEIPTEVRVFHEIAFITTLLNYTSHRHLSSPDLWRFHSVPEFWAVRGAGSDAGRLVPLLVELIFEDNGGGRERAE